MGSPDENKPHPGTLPPHRGPSPEPGGGLTTMAADTDRMTQAANALVELRGDTEKADNTADQDTMDAVTGLNKHTAPGLPEEGAWETAGALSNLGIRWLQQVTHLKGLLQDISEKLHTTTRRYTDAEREERARMNSVHTPFG